jgi:hypothetical protein
MKKILCISVFVSLIIAGNAFCDVFTIADAGPGPGIAEIGIANGSLAVYAEGDIAGYGGGPTGTTMAVTSGSTKAKPDTALIFAMRGSIDPDQADDLSVYQKDHTGAASIVAADLAIDADTTQSNVWVVRGRTLE